MKFEIAKRFQEKLRIGIFGPSGSGKTKGALRLAHGLTGDWAKVAVIDTEHNSANLFAHLGPYRTLRLDPPFSPERYVEAIRLGIEAKFEVIIVDSISHEWEGIGGILEIVENAPGLNQYTKWSTVTKRHNSFIDTILRSPTHMICCGRTKNDVVLEKNEKGKEVPVKVGIKVVTRENFDYEMTLCFDLGKNHIATTSKDRTELYMDKYDLQLTESMGEALIEWANNGEVNVAHESQTLIDQSSELFKELGWEKPKCVDFLRRNFNAEMRNNLTLPELRELVSKLNSIREQANA